MANLSRLSVLSFLIWINAVVMNLVDEKIETYATNHSQPTSALTNQVYEWTTENTDAPMMLSGPLQVSLLQLLAQSVNARRILEIGMFTGYSALAMAEVLPDDGQLITLDVDDEREGIARNFFDQSPHGAKIEIVIAPALDTIPGLEGEFDLAYIDADKLNYLNYYEAVMPLMRRGALIVADNVLWSGSVLNPDTDESSALCEYNRHVCADDRVTNVLLPIRDGLMACAKKLIEQPIELICRLAAEFSLLFQVFHSMI